MCDYHLRYVDALQAIIDSCQKTKKAYEPKGNFCTLGNWFKLSGLECPYQKREYDKTFTCTRWKPKSDVMK